MKKIFSILYKLCALMPGSSRSSFSNKLRLFFLKKITKQFGDDCIVRSGAIINNPSLLSIGDNSGIGFRALISCEDNVVIGSRVLMGADVIIYTSNHIWSEAKCTYFGQGLTRAGVVIEDDVWLGARCIILPGVIIGKGATIAAGAVVTKNVLPYAVMAGVPARVVKIKSALG